MKFLIDTATREPVESLDPSGQPVDIHADLLRQIGDVVGLDHHAGIQPSTREALPTLQRCDAAVLGLVNTSIIVRETAEAVFGLVALVATITLLFPFADPALVPPWSTRARS